MILKVVVDDQLYELNVPEKFIRQANSFFDSMDRDMDSGWQMSRDWVDHPNIEQRCRIVADKLLTALEKENHKLGRLMAGYILSRMPEVETIEPDTGGEIQNTRLTLRSAPPRPDQLVSPALDSAAPEGQLDKMEALDRAGRDVTKVFKVGRHWRFSVYDHASEQWQDSPAVADKQEAERLRQQAFKKRYEDLTAGGRSS
jgi:hypothetical protein